MSEANNNDPFCEPPINSEDIRAVRTLSIDQLFERYDMQTSMGQYDSARVYLMEIQRRRDNKFQTTMIASQERIELSQHRVERRENEMLWLTRAVVALAVVTLVASIMNAIPLVSQWLG